MIIPWMVRNKGKPGYGRPRSSNVQGKKALISQILIKIVQMKTIVKSSWKGKAWG